VKFIADRLLLFGATGDLAKRMLLPSLCALDADDLIDPKLEIVGTARSDFDDQGFRNFAREALEKFLPPERRGSVATFLNRLSYQSLDATQIEGFEQLAAKVGTPERGLAIFLSTAPSLFDVKGTPVARIHPGVEILATAIDNFKNGDALRERPSWIMISAALLLIWSMAIALHRQVHIDVFDTVFGVLQVGLVLIAYAVVNLSSWYLDTSAPLSLGVMYFTVARLYYGIAHGWLADSQVNGIMARPAGTRLLAVLALRLDGATAAERRRLKGELDRLVARSTLGPGRISRLIEDPGLVQDVFTGTMLVYWLAEDPELDWRGDASRIEEALRRARPKQHWDRRLVCARHAALLSWKSTEEWNAAAASTILAALTATLTPSPETPR